MGNKVISCRACHDTPPQQPGKGILPKKRPFRNNRGSPHYAAEDINLDFPTFPRPIKTRGARLGATSVKKDKKSIVVKKDDTSADISKDYIWGVSNAIDRNAGGVKVVASEPRIESESRVTSCCTPGGGAARAPSKSSETSEKSKAVIINLLTPKTDSVEEKNETEAGDAAFDFYNTANNYLETEAEKQASAGDPSDGKNKNVSSSSWFGSWFSRPNDERNVDKSTRTQNNSSLQPNATYYSTDFAHHDLRSPSSYYNVYEQPSFLGHNQNNFHAKTFTTIEEDVYNNSFMAPYYNSPGRPGEAIVGARSHTPNILVDSTDPAGRSYLANLLFGDPGITENNGGFHGIGSAHQQLYNQQHHENTGFFGRYDHDPSTKLDHLPTDFYNFGVADNIDSGSTYHHHVDHLSSNLYGSSFADGLFPVNMGSHIPMMEESLLAPLPSYHTPSAGHHHLEYNHLEYDLKNDVRNPPFFSSDLVGGHDASGEASLTGAYRYDKPAGNFGFDTNKKTSTSWGGGVAGMDVASRDNNRRFDEALMMPENYNSPVSLGGSRSFDPRHNFRTRL